MIYLNEDIESINVGAALRKVSAQRAAYALRYRQERDRKLSLAVYLLLLEVLEKEYGINELPEFDFEYHGKPKIKGHSEIHFNLSHCLRAALCVIDNQPVGCDVESVPDELDMDVCRHCFNEEEIAGIVDSAQPTLAFTTLWTKKEAFLKLTGEGLTDNLPSLLTTPQAEKVAFETHIATDNSYVYSICRWIDS